MTNKRKNKTHQ